MPDIERASPSSAETDATASGSRATPTATPRPDALTIAVVGLFVLALLAALYVGHPVLLPLAAALLISFILRPVVRFLSHWRVPAPLSALVLVGLVGGLLALAVYGLSEPASQWIRDAPRSLRQLQYRIEGLKKPMEEMKQATEEVEKLGRVGKPEAPEVVIKDEQLDRVLLLQTREAVFGVLTALIMLFFLLGWGGRLFRNMIRALPSFHDQRQAVLVAQDIESAVSTYLATISIINLGLGAVVAGVLYLLGMPNPVLWGAVTALLNFVPYLGPAVTAAILAVVALMTYPTIGQALVVPAAFLAITSMEGYFVTPMAVGKRLILNPLLIFVSLVFWFWLWGIIGALLTVPILVCVKVTLDRIDSVKPLARILD